MKCLPLVGRANVAVVSNYIESEVTPVRAVIFFAQGAKSDMRRKSAVRFLYPPRGMSAVSRREMFAAVGGQTLRSLSNYIEREVFGRAASEQRKSEKSRVKKR